MLYSAARIRGSPYKLRNNMTLLKYVDPHAEFTLACFFRCFCHLNLDQLLHHAADTLHRRTLLHNGLPFAEWPLRSCAMPPSASGPTGTFPNSARLSKTLFADNPLRSDLDRARDPRSSRPRKSRTAQSARLRCGVLYRSSHAPVSGQLSLDRQFNVSTGTTRVRSRMI